MLSQQIVDDVLISALYRLIPIDDYLGYVDYSRVHLHGFETVIRIRGGYDRVGQSVPAISKDMQMSVLVARSLLLIHLQTSLIEGLPPDIIRCPETTWLRGIELILPPGFVGLISAGHLSHSSIEILLSFSEWLGKYRGLDPGSIPVWRYSSSGELTAVEKCIFVGLLCLADDVGYMGMHPAAIIFRQPKKRAEMLLAVKELWNDPSLADCLLWLWTVITIPQNPGITPVLAQRELFSKILTLRDGLSDWNVIRAVLRRFFYEDSRAPAWENAWTVMHDEAQKTPASSSKYIDDRDRTTRNITAP
ncbi:uncharacterized protein ACLA_002850 [Aspergillus clavatus NRRL 1]|uniref:Uncharacterized protein n=1 Tax=Aspergillus clavatus (strain ATCC 1007 / CBS 513.65 / DSM 816 / NCTC 3887 / NRRL 1 / QM 1276 / 107) TaxID=344612 RepID=A1C5A6_ASPCL|nr:uncharacterized protein ACLA_002850 [Aspergillus clavatus NRRL 1]EAW14874.1 hypothetical protein ACLA_002850 [Aspergillus clavatus NRRL 1]